LARSTAEARVKADSERAERRAAEAIIQSSDSAGNC
jgi:hypothetical protein